MNKIIGKIILLLKNIWLVEPDKEDGYEARFFAGKKDPFTFGGGIGIAWWHTKQSLRAVEDIARMIIGTIPEFRDCDLESIESVIKDVLKEMCVDRRIFNSDEVCFPKGKKLLFECINYARITQGAEIILDAIIMKLRGRISKWCTVYVAPRIAGMTFSIPQEGLSIVNKSDEAAWKELCDRGYCTDQWLPITGLFIDGGHSPLSHLEYKYVFVAEGSGTQKGSKFECALKFRRLFAVMCAIVSERYPYALSKCAADPYEHCIQFPDLQHRHLGAIMSEIGAMVPYYISDLILTAEDITSIQSWFQVVVALPVDVRNRIEKCAHFINRAMISNDAVESFVGYFISLDALLGIRGDVEKSIISGIDRLGLGQLWVEKVKKLYDLRNELVHGGSRHIQEWRGYSGYYRHFNSKPHHDMEQIAFSVLRIIPYCADEILDNYKKVSTNIESECSAF